MGVRILGVRKTRAVERVVGEPVLRAWGNGHPSILFFVTPDHRHGAADRRTGEVTFHGDLTMHSVSCETLFSGAPCPDCGHEDHGEFAECTRRVDWARGVCYHRADVCPDPDLHQREDQVTRPCRCPRVQR